MRRAVPFVLALSLLAFLPLAAQAASLDQLHNAIFATASASPPDTPPCEPGYTCTKVFSDCSFINQKPNYMCVYLCSYTQTCVDDLCGTSDVVTTGTGRYRIGPYAPGQCPPGTAEIGEQGLPD